MSDLLIIPDVHGRLFWKQAIDKYPDLETVFLGDYLDPYYYNDGVSPKQAFEVFQEIIELAKNNKNIHLLFGNHDWHYIHEIDFVRIDYLNRDKIRKIFLDNINLFNLAFEWKTNNQRYLFTHAGVTSNWVKYLVDRSYLNVDINGITSDVLNNMFNNEQYVKALSMIGYYRGGNYSYGSPIWADIREHLEDENDIINYYQIFAHNYCKRHIVRDRFAMLDCAKAFILKNNGELKKIEEMIDIDNLISIAIRGRDNRLRDTYRAIKTKIIEFKTAKDHKEYDKVAEVNILKKMYDERIENAKIYRENGREDLANIEMEEADAISKLLPKTPTEEDIIIFLDSRGYDNINKRDIGKIVNEAKSELLGVDGKLLFNIISKRVK